MMFVVTTVDGRNSGPVEVGSISHYLQGFYTSQVVVWDFWTINSITLKGGQAREIGTVCDVLIPGKYHKLGILHTYVIFFCIYTNIFYPNLNQPILHKQLEHDKCSNQSHHTGLIREFQFMDIRKPHFVQRVFTPETCRYNTRESRCKNPRWYDAFDGSEIPNGQLGCINPI